MRDQYPNTKTPSQEYFSASQEPSHASNEPRKQLLILDLNGTLISRVKGKAKSYYARPHHKIFLDFIFQYFKVMVWSSAQHQSVKSMCKIFKQPLELVWNRDHFQLDEVEFYSKTETIKDLDKVWQHFSYRYNATNTIILDDTDSKLVYQPYNLIFIKTFNYNRIIRGATDHELLKVMLYLDELKWHSNVTNFIRNFPFNSSHYNISIDWTLDSAMTHFSSKGKTLGTFNRTEPIEYELSDEANDGHEQVKRELSETDSDSPVQEPPKKKKKAKTAKTAVPVGNVVNAAVDNGPTVAIKKEPADIVAIKDEPADTVAVNDEPAPITELRPQTRRKLKSILDNIKHRKMAK